MSSTKISSKEMKEPAVTVVEVEAKKQRDTWTRITHSFRRKENDAGHEFALGDADLVREAGDLSRLNRKLQTRHLSMIAIGGSIGCGLFIGSGDALKTGGPGAVVLDFCLIGLMIFCTMNAMGELASLFPVQGSIAVYSARFIDPAWGFAMAWNYALCWLVIFPFEILCGGYVMQYWVSPDVVPILVWIIIFWLFVLVINLFGVRGYGEGEYIFSLIKVCAVIIFIILGIVINAGAVPNYHGVPLGTKYWKDPGAFNNGFQGICAVFVTAAFSFAGTELAGLAAAETANPREAVPRATKQVFWRVALFYIISLAIIGSNVPFNHPRLGVKGNSADAKASPFVIAVLDAGIPVMPHIVNAVILISVLSVGNASTFAASRTLEALAEIGQAPRFFSYIDKKGRPLATLALVFGLGPLAFVGAFDGGALFGWLFALCGLSSFLTWGSLCFAHIRFRAAIKAQIHRGELTLEELPYTAILGVTGSWIGFIMACICIIATIYTACNPGGDFDVVGFFQEVLALPICIACYIFWKLWKKPSIIKAAQADLVSGRREMDLKEEKEKDLLERATWGPAKRFVPNL